MSEVAPDKLGSGLFDEVGGCEAANSSRRTPWRKLWRALWRVYVDRLVQALAQQAPQAVLWWPVGLATGIGLFFASPSDPPAWIGLVILATMLSGFVRFRSNFAVRSILLGLILAAFGFCAAQMRTQWVAAPILAERLGPITITGSVAMVEPKGSANRVTLAQLSVPYLEGPETPKQVRVRLPSSHGAPQIGQQIQVRAIISPPGRPVTPGGFDFQRHSFFRQLGGVGFAVGTWQLVGDVEHESLTWRDRVNELRAKVANRIALSLPGEAGGIARALVTGERNAVPEPLQEAYRNAGLAHMLAISGLHMSLLTGLVFILFRYGLALSVPLAERFNTKKMAAFFALGAAAFYLLLSGMNVPAQRAFIMISVVLFAVLIDRTALSLRTLAWAAIAVLLLQPDALVGASFQLSFAAVVALITVYERVHIRASLWDRYGNFRLFRAMFLYAAAVLVTDLIATGATAPFTAFHFHLVPSYSLLANLMAGPIMGLWIMPFGLIALVLMPLGLESVPLSAMGAGIDLVNAIARFVSGLPGSTFHTPPAEVWALVCVGVGGLFLCLWRGKARFLGLFPLSVGLLQPWFSESPHILINESAEVLAVRGVDGKLTLTPGRGDGFTRNVWIEHWGKSTDRWQEHPALSCDAEGCIYRAEDGRSIGLAYTESAVSEDCGRVDLIVAKVPSWRLCSSGQSIDRFDIWRYGAHAIWLTDGEPRIERVSDYTGRRIWNQPTWR